jgi:serine/threonine-protein phosphatase 2B catalytic subunit
VYEACIKSFCALPVTALVDDRFFCVHGGISPSLLRLSDLKKVRLYAAVPSNVIDRVGHQMNRFMEPGNDGLLCDLLWCDPIANFGRENEPSAQGPGFRPGTLFLPNATRGCSYYFT